MYHGKRTSTHRQRDRQAKHRIRAAKILQQQYVLHYFALRVLTQRAKFIVVRVDPSCIPDYYRTTLFLSHIVCIYAYVVFGL